PDQLGRGFEEAAARLHPGRDQTSGATGPRELEAQARTVSTSAVALIHLRRSALPREEHPGAASIFLICWCQSALHEISLFAPRGEAEVRDARDETDGGENYGKGNERGDRTEQITRVERMPDVFVRPGAHHRLRERLAPDHRQPEAANRSPRPL